MPMISVSLLPKIHPDTIFPSMPSSSEWSLPFMVFQPKCTHFTPFPCMIHAPSILSPWLEFTIKLLITENMNLSNQYTFKVTTHHKFQCQKIFTECCAFCMWWNYIIWHSYHTLTRNKCWQLGQLIQKMTCACMRNSIHWNVNCFLKKSKIKI